MAYYCIDKKVAPDFSHRIHRVLPNPCSKLPKLEAQTNLGYHEDFQAAMNCAKKRFPSAAKFIKFCDECYDSYEI